MSEVVQYVPIALQGCAERYVEKEKAVRNAYLDLEKHRQVIKVAEEKLRDAKVELAAQAEKFYGGKLNIMIAKGECMGGVLRVDMTPSSIAGKRKPEDAAITVEKVEGSLR